MGKRTLEIPYLLELQKNSYEEFLQRDIPPHKRENKGLEELFRRIFPIESDDGILRLEYLGYTLEPPIETVEECIEKGTTYEARLKVKFRLIRREKTPSNELKVKSVKEQEIYIGSIPLMTENGSFIINGVERVVVHQLLRCPGVYFKEEGVSGQRVLY